MSNYSFSKDFFDKLFDMVHREKERIEYVQHIIEKYVENTTGFKLEYHSIDDNETWAYMILGRKSDKYISDEKELRQDLTILKKAIKTSTSINNDILRTELQNEIEKIKNKLEKPQVKHQIPIFNEIIKKMNPNMKKMKRGVAISHILNELGLFDKEPFPVCGTSKKETIGEADIWDRMKNYSEMLD